MFSDFPNAYTTINVHTCHVNLSACHSCIYVTRIFFIQQDKCVCVCFNLTLACRLQLNSSDVLLDTSINTYIIPFSNVLSPNKHTLYSIKIYTFDSFSHR